MSSLASLSSSFSGEFSALTSTDTLAGAVDSFLNGSDNIPSSGEEGTLPRPASFAETIFFNPQIDNSNLGFDGSDSSDGSMRHSNSTASLNSVASTESLASVGSAAAEPPKSRAEILKAAGHQRQRSRSELPRPSWDVIRGITEPAEAPQSEEPSKSSTLLLPRKPRKRSFNTAGDRRSRGGSTMLNILELAKLPPGIKTEKVSDTEINVAVADTLNDLMAVVLNESEIHQSFIHTFYCVYRVFLTAEELYERISNRFLELEVLIEQANNESEDQWYFMNQGRLLTLMKTWVTEFPFDFMRNKSLTLRMRTFLRDPKHILEEEHKRTSMSILGALDIAAEPRTPPAFFESVYNPPVKDKEVSAELAMVDGVGFFELNPADFVQQLTLIENEMFRRISLEELLSRGWLMKNSRKTTPNIVFIITWFNKITHWVATEICTCGNLKMRVSLIERFITMARMAREWNNFNTTFEIVLGLNMTPVQRMDKTWEKVSAKLKKDLKSLNDFVSAERNHKRYRSAIKDSTGALPYMGVFMKDVAVIHETSSVYDAEGKIRFHSFNTIGNAILNVRRFQKHDFPFKPNKAIVAWLKHKIIALEDKELYEASRANQGSNEV